MIYQARFLMRPLIFHLVILGIGFVPQASFIFYLYFVIKILQMIDGRMLISKLSECDAIAHVATLGCNSGYQITNVLKFYGRSNQQHCGAWLN